MRKLQNLMYMLTNMKQTSTFFLAHYFKDNYDVALANLPFVNSAINITKVEVWVTNKTGTTENTRNIVSFLDLGETEVYNTNSNFAGALTFQEVPDNATNNLFYNLTNQHSGIRDINQVNNTIFSLFCFLSQPPKIMKN